MLPVSICLRQNVVKLGGISTTARRASQLGMASIETSSRKPVCQLGLFKSYSTFNPQSAASPRDKPKNKVSLWTKLKSFTTFTASGTLVIGAAGLSAVVIYLILSELFSPSGDTQIFNRSVSMIEKDEVARSLLQCHDTADSKERLKAYGESFTSDKWTRNRPIVSTTKFDKTGKAHHFMRFHVESKKTRGLVHIEAVDSDNSYQPAFTSVYLDVPGESRHYLIKPKVHKIAKPSGFLGVNWGPKKA